VNLNFPNAIKPIMPLNVILGLITFVYMGNAFQKEKGKVCEEIVAYPFGYP
jgi:hypothetical protein